MSVCLCSGDYINTEEVYEDITNAAALKKKMVELLTEYNNSPGVVRMDLVLFRDAIDHGIQYNAIKYLYSAYSHRVSRALRRRELISNVQKGRF